MEQVDVLYVSRPHLEACGRLDEILATISWNSNNYVITVLLAQILAIQIKSLVDYSNITEKYFACGCSYF